MPSAATRFCTTGSANAFTTAALSLATISLGVPFGAHSPCQNEMSIPVMPISSMVGTSGSPA